MGRSQSKVPITRNAKSIMHPGQKSCVSGPLNRFCTYETAWAILVELLTSTTHSIVDSAKMGKVVEMKVEEISETECVVTRKINGPAFDAELATELGLGRQLLFEPDLKGLTRGQQIITDKIRMDKNEERRLITIEKIILDPPRLANTTHIALHRRPFRLEYWIEAPRPRFNHPLLKEGMLGELDVIMHRALQGDDYMKVMWIIKRLGTELVKKWEHSLSHPIWDAYVSEPLEDIIGFDRLWAELKDITKFPPRHPNSTIQQFGDNVFHLTVPKKFAEVKKKKEKPVKVEELEDAAEAEREEGEAADTEAEKKKKEGEAGKDEERRQEADKEKKDEKSSKEEAAKKEDKDKRPDTDKKEDAKKEGGDAEEEKALVKAEAEDGEESEYEVEMVAYDYERKMQLTIDEDTHTIRSVRYEGNGNIKNIDYHVLHRSPLQLEVWSERPPHRYHGTMIKAMSQPLIDAIIDRAEMLDGCMQDMDETFFDCDDDDDGYQYHTQSEDEPEAKDVGAAEAKPEQPGASASGGSGARAFDFNPRSR